MQRRLRNCHVNAKQKNQLKNNYYAWKGIEKMQKRIFKAKRCERCFKTYLPSSGVQKYCENCGAIVAQEKKHYYNLHQRRINRLNNQLLDAQSKINNERNLDEFNNRFNHNTKKKDVMKRIENIMIIWLLANILTNIALTLIHVITFN